MGTQGSQGGQSSQFYHLCSICARDLNPVLPFYTFPFLCPILFWPQKKKKEKAQQTLYFAHLFFVDHMFSTAWTLFFAVGWWVYTPHDGRRVANSAAQEAIRHGAGVNQTMTETELAVAANILWDEERGVAAMVIILSWLAKVRCIMVLFMDVGQSCYV